MENAEHDRHAAAEVFFYDRGGDIDKDRQPRDGQGAFEIVLESVQLTPQRPKKTQSTKKRAVWRKALSQYRSAKAAALSSTDVPRISFTMGITPQIQNMKWSKIIKRTQSPLKNQAPRTVPRRGENKLSLFHVMFPPAAGGSFRYAS